MAPEAADNLVSMWPDGLRVKQQPIIHLVNSYALITITSSFKFKVVFNLTELIFYKNFISSLILSYRQYPESYRHNQTFY